MGTLTKADLRDRVGRRLKLIGEGSDLTGYQSVQIDRAIDDVSNLLTEQSLVTWNADEIPDFLAIPLRDYVASFIGELASAEVQSTLQARRPIAYTEILNLLRTPGSRSVRADSALLRMGRR